MFVYMEELLHFNIILDNNKCEPRCQLIYPQSLLYPVPPGGQKKLIAFS